MQIKYPAALLYGCSHVERAPTCNWCNLDSPRRANKSQAKPSTDGPGMSSRLLTVVPSGPAAAPSAHLSAHLRRGKALRPDTLRACCSILLTEIMERSPRADAHFLSPAGLEALFITPQPAPRTRGDNAVHFRMEGGGNRGCVCDEGPASAWMRRWRMEVCPIIEPNKDHPREAAHVELQDK